MAKITLTKGSLYFLKEKDYLTEKISSYVKIGLVRDDKKTSGRIAEHQTGNPRKIYDHQSLDTPFVEHLETQLHYRFANKWITGEWFDLTDAELTDVILEAKKIIKEQEDIAKVLKRSYKLAKLESTKEERDPTEDEKELWQKLIDKKLEQEINKAKRDIVASTIKKALGNAGEIPGVVTVQIKKGREDFNEVAFKEKHPELHEEFCTKKTEVLSGLFTLKNKKNIKKEEPALYEDIAALAKITLEAKDIAFETIAERTTLIEQAHKEYINHQKQAYVLEWEYDRLEAQLKYNTGLHRGLTDLCGWNRSIKEMLGFDKNEFIVKHPEIYKDFKVQGPDSVAVLIYSWRAYS